MAIFRFAARALRLLRLLSASALSLHALDCVAAERLVKLGGMDVGDAPGVAVLRFRAGLEVIAAG